MSQVTFKGNPIQTAARLPEIGSSAPDFTVVKTDLAAISQSELKGRKVVLNIFPSVDTPVCAASVRRFNEEAAKFSNTTVLCISRDLPFAHKRFCAAEGIDNVIAGSEYRDTSFSDAYGVLIQDGPLAGLFSRAIVIIDEQGAIVYTEQVPEIGQEPDYDRALAAINK